MDDVNIKEFIQGEDLNMNIPISDKNEKIDTYIIKILLDLR